MHLLLDNFASAFKPVNKQQSHQFKSKRMTAGNAQVGKKAEERRIE